MSLMDQIQRAWDAEVIAVNGHHSYENIPAPSLAQEFFKRLNQIHSSSIELIVATLWSGYSSIKPSYNGLKMDYEKLEEEHHKLKDKHDQLSKRFNLIQRVKKQLKEEVQDLKILDALSNHRSNDLLDQRDDLESSLNTSRYFIFLSGMCGFVLGLACLYLVV